MHKAETGNVNTWEMGFNERRIKWFSLKCVLESYHGLGSGWKIHVFLLFVFTQWNIWKSDDASIIHRIFWIRFVVFLTFLSIGVMKIRLLNIFKYALLELVKHKASRTKSTISQRNLHLSVVLLPQLLSYTKLNKVKCFTTEFFFQ